MTDRRPTAVPRPFFEGGPDPSLRQRLLLISYHFPPGQAAGALRWQKLAALAAERGWGVDVITLDPEDLSNLDTSRLERLPAGIRIFGVREQSHWIEGVETVAWRVHRRLRALLERKKSAPAESGGPVPVSRAVARPDSRTRADLKAQRRIEPRQAYYAWLDYARQGRWARQAAEMGEALVESRVHRAIVTCGPPHMVHEGGRILSYRTGLPHVMDMRDPWSLVQRLAGPIASPVWLSLAEKYEQRAIGQAAMIVTNTEAVRRAMQECYPTAAPKVVVVMNGYDEEPLPPPARDFRFLVAYAGTIYLDRDPRPLFTAAARVIREFGLSPAEFGIEFMGYADTYNGLPLLAIAEAEGIGEFVCMHPPASRAKALEFLSHGSLLVSLPQDSDMAIPSKVFEYMQYEAWVLALADRGSATEVVLRETTADVVAPGDVDGLAEVLRRRYRQHRDGERPAPIVWDERYSRRAQAQVLFDRIDALIGEPISVQVVGVAVPGPLATPARSS